MNTFHQILYYGLEVPGNRVPEGFDRDFWSIQSIYSEYTLVIDYVWT